MGREFPVTIFRKFEDTSQEIAVSFATGNYLKFKPEFYVLRESAQAHSIFLIYQNEPVQKREMVLLNFT